MRGAFLLLGVPWLALFVGAYLTQIGTVTFYTVGDDWLQFQRYAYRIYMQGYWLEGGQKTFWFQPLYRWLVGGLHVIFGDSSIAETYPRRRILVHLQHAGLLSRQARGRFPLGPHRRGALAGDVRARSDVVHHRPRPVGDRVRGVPASAVFCVFRARSGRLSPALFAAAFAVLAFYTRLNNLPSALATVVFAASLNVRAVDVDAA